MDVTFTNVLEGARQYFQGLPAGTGSTAGPTHADTHGRNENENGGGAATDQSQLAASGYWQQAQDHQRPPPPRDHTPVQQQQQQQQQQQRPPSHLSDSSRPPSHSHPLQYVSVSEQHGRLTKYPSSYAESATSQTPFQFSRPQSREQPQNHSHQLQYPQHITTSATYHQSPSPRIQTSRAQESQQIPPPHSQSYQSYPHSRYYPVQSQAKPVSTSSSLSYSAASSQGYQPTQNAYYKHSYTQQTPSSTPNIYHTSQSQAIQRHTESKHMPVTSAPVSSYQNEVRTTHNLPPIAALSATYQPRSREPPRLNNPRPRTTATAIPSYPQQASSITTPVYQNNSSLPYSSGYSENKPVSSYNSHVSQPNVSYHHSSATTTTTPSYSHVIVTSSTVSNSYTAPQQSSSQYYQSVKPSSFAASPSRSQPSNIVTNHVSTVPQPQHHHDYDRNVNNGRLAPIIKQKRESPLDLSVKTVRTSADSTLDDAEDARMKYYHQNRHPSISAHSYPQYDVNFQRNVPHRSAPTQPSATAPKVEFNPNFNIQSLNQHPGRGFAQEMQRNHAMSSEKPHTANKPMDKYPVNQQPNIGSRYPTMPIPSAHINSHLLQKQPHNSTPSRGGPSTNNNLKPQSNYFNAGHELNKKRVLDPGPSIIPKKMQKIDAWRQSIDQEIDQRLSSYKQEQQQKYNPTSNVVNGSYQSVVEKKNDAMSSRQPTAFLPITQQPFSNYNTHNQTYVPSAASHQYPGYTPGMSNQQQPPYQQHRYPRSNPSTMPPYNSKSNAGGGANKTVLSLLRNSLEVKEQKRLEQSKIHEAGQQQARSEVQHPSTDVTAPIQPKPGFNSRNNVSPFTPTSFPETSNGIPMYKFPKAIDSVNYDGDSKNSINVDKSNDDITIISNNSTNSEFDGLAARIRTKGELKQGGQVSTGSGASKLQQAFVDNQIKSPFKQELPTLGSAAATNLILPKLIKDKPSSLVPPRRRLFSRTEEDGSNNVPHRDKSGLRSSSETSVFDFPDTDSENEMERQSLHAMRRDRKASVKYVSNASLDVKPESPRAPSPFDDMFAQVCDNFMEQLKNGNCRKKGGRKKKFEPEVLASLQTTTKENPVDADVVVKVEPEEIAQTEPEAVAVKREEDNNTSKEEKPLLRQCEELVIKLEALKQDEKSKEPPVADNTKAIKRNLFSSSEDEEVKTENKPANESKVEIKKEEASETDAKPSETETDNPTPKPEAPIVTRPAKKPSFGDGSDFYPGWEESLCKYKRSCRVPASLIQVTRPPQLKNRLSTSLPDLDPSARSPTHSLTNDGTNATKKMHKIKSEPIDSDVDSNCSFNLFSKHSSYDSEGGSSIKSLPIMGREGNSILDRLLEKCGGKKKKKNKKKDEGVPKVMPKAENPVELLPTPSLEVQNKENDKKLHTQIIKSESALLGFRKQTIENYKDEFIKGGNLLGVNKFSTTIVLSSRTRKETRVLKQRATIKEVFGDDRPASAPPIPCVHAKEDTDEKMSIASEELRIKDEPHDQNEDDQTFQSELDTKQMLKNKLLNKNKTCNNDNLKTDKKIKSEILDEPDEDTIREDIMKNILIDRDPEIKSETPSIDDEGSISGKRKSKLRRKLSSGFDYIRKKKKAKKETSVEAETASIAKARRRGAPVKSTPESVQDIQKEIKTWVLNKGIGESHLHRAARLGYTEITAFCLEKMDCPPSPRDNAGYTPLHEACSRGHLDIAKLLLLFGADVSESAQGGIRPLHEAVENGFVEIVRLLLSYGADPYLATYSGQTPLALAKDDLTAQFLKEHINDIEGNPGSPWLFPAVQSENDFFETGYDVLDGAPSPDSDSDNDDIEFEMSEQLLPNLYTLRGEPSNERWILLQDLSSLLKIKSRDALLKQITPPSTSSSSSASKTVLRELKMTEFLEQARCCQFLNAGEKVNTRASKIALVKYTDKVKELLNVETVTITNR